MYLPLHALQPGGLNKPIHDPVHHPTPRVPLRQDGTLRLSHDILVQKMSLFLHRRLTEANEPLASRLGHLFQMAEVEDGRGADDEDNEYLGGTARDGPLDAIDGEERFGVARMLRVETRVDYLARASRRRRRWEAVEA
jgi:hypothetical protein